jgi:CheY-like chemotaxis protein
MCAISDVRPGLLNGSETGSRTVRVLVLDDEMILLEIIGEFLTTFGYHAELVGSEAEAVAALARDGTPDLMIIDYMLQGINGIEAYTRLTAAAGRHIPAILLSGLGNDELAAEAAGCGMKPVRKPVKMDQLFEIIEGMLDEAQAPA